MPETLTCSAVRNTANGVSTSSSTWNVVSSSPRLRTRDTRNASSAASTRPKAMPPKKLTKNAPVAEISEKVPVVSAAIENWNETTPEASLMSDSPESRIDWRRLRLTRFESEATATASVGPSAAPRAKAAASGMVGSRACNVKPMQRMVTTTRPTASESTFARFDHNATLSVLRAS